ncbi:MAG: hypothetical protein Q8S24_11200 [Eubacteriales bacterium]|nr:hypothetical protein [Eubacteriales bacterium]
MKLKQTILLFLLIAVLVLTGCVANTDENISQLRKELSAERNKTQALESKLMEYSETINDLRLEVKDREKTISDFEASLLISEPVQGNSLLTEALNVIEIIAEYDIVKLNAFISPTKGVRFSPYTYVHEDDDMLFFTGNALVNLFNDTAEYTWGSYDGSGEPIELTFSDYYDRFVYDQDFANPHMIGINQTIGTGNTINNISDVYSNHAFVEFHFTGFDPQYEGIDWRSLTLVFENDNGVWYLVGIVHSEWTI